MITAGVETEGMRAPTRRGLRGVKRVIADAHQGLKASAKVQKATTQRCRVHFMRNVLDHVPEGQRQRDAAHIRTVFARESEDEAEPDVLAHLSFAKAHRLQIHRNNPLERLNAEVSRRTDVVGIFPSGAAIVRMVGTLLLEQDDEWQPQRRSLQLEGLQSLGDNRPVRPSAAMI